MNDLFKAAPHIAMHRGATMVVKAGGGTLTRPHWLRQFSQQIAVIRALGARVVVVHGAGPQTDTIQRMFGEEPEMVDGRRVTTPTALRALRFATSELNADLAAELTHQGAPAIGLSAASGGLLVATRRPPMETTRGLVELGLVGDVSKIDPKPILACLEAGYVPVISPPASDGAGGFLNINADLAAAAIACALSAAKLVLATGAPGILRRRTDPESLVSALSLSELDALLAEGALQEGMRVKASAIRTALLGGVHRVHVVSGSEPDALLRELYTTQGCGTLVTLEPEKAPAAAAVAATV